MTIGHQSILVSRQIPFPTGAPDELFFSTPVLEQRLELLHHLIQFGNHGLVIRAPAGYGKTTLVNELLRRHSKGWHLAFIQATSNLTADDFERQVLGQFRLGADRTSSAQRLPFIDQHLQNLQRNQQTILIVIDDAMFLPTSTREFLVARGQHWGLFGVRFLFLKGSDPTVLDAATAGEERVPNISEITLPGFDKEQTREYLVARLTHAGWRGEIPFSDADVHHFYSASGGAPGALHDLANSHMEGGPFSIDTTRQNKTRKRFASLGLATLIILGFYAIAWLRHDDGSESDEARKVAMVHSSQSVTSTEQPAATPLETTLSPTTIMKASNMQAPTGEMVATLSVPAPALPVSLTTQSSVLGEGLGEVVGKAVSASADDTIVAIPPVALPQSPPTSQQSVDNAVLAAVPRWENQPLADLTTMRDKEWLIGQPETAFTIQLLGTYSRPALEKYLLEHQLGERTAWFSTRHLDRPWFVGVYGVYSNRDVARDAILTLPDAVRSRGPWLRSIRSIVDSISEPPDTAE